MIETEQRIETQLQSTRLTTLILQEEDITTTNSNLNEQEQLTSQIITTSNSNQQSPRHSLTTSSSSSDSTQLIPSLSNPPSQTNSTKVGIWSEGSSYPSGFGIRIDSRSHLEVFDKKHRYGKNLRMYYKEWVRQRIELQFFEWLNSPTLTELSDCSKAALDNDTVYYCKVEADREQCLVRIAKNGIFHHRKCSTDSETPSWQPLTTQGDGNGWIFVLKNNKIYANEKITNRQPRFHHSSFFGGADVDAAGMFVVENGKLTRLFPHSGHYRPGEVHMYFLLHYLDTCGVPLKDVDCDAQRLAHVTRQVSEKGGKARKIDTPYMWRGDYMLNFLRAKKLFWDYRIATLIKNHPLFLKYSNSDTQQQQPSSTSTSTVESSSIPPLPPLPPVLERQSSSGNVIHTSTAPVYSSGTFGGGGIGEPLALIPAISTYPLTAKLRDDLLSKVKTQQQQQQSSESGSQTVPVMSSTPSMTTSMIGTDPKDAGVVLLSEQSNREMNGGGKYQPDCLG